MARAGSVIDRQDASSVASSVLNDIEWAASAALGITETRSNDISSLSDSQRLSDTGRGAMDKRSGTTKTNSENEFQTDQNPSEFLAKTSWRGAVGEGSRNIARKSNRARDDELQEAIVDCVPVQFSYLGPSVFPTVMLLFGICASAVWCYVALEGSYPPAVSTSFFFWMAFSALAVVSLVFSTFCCLPLYVVLTAAYLEVQFTLRTVRLPLCPGNLVIKSVGWLQSEFCLTAVNGKATAYQPVVYIRSGGQAVLFNPKGGAEPFIKTIRSLLVPREESKEITAVDGTS